jgi:hypothetical protein
LFLPLIPLIPAGIHLKIKVITSAIVSMFLKMLLPRSRNMADAHQSLHRLPLSFFIPANVAVNLEKSFRMGRLLFLRRTKQRSMLGNRLIMKGKLCTCVFARQCCNKLPCPVFRNCCIIIHCSFPRSFRENSRFFYSDVFKDEARALRVNGFPIQHGTRDFFFVAS